MKGEYRQVVRLAQPVELNAYVVFEHQLDLLAQGSPASLLLNFALFFLGSEFCHQFSERSLN